MKIRLLSLIRKEFIQTFRDVPIVVLVVYTFAEIALCGWALTMDVRNVPTAVLDRDDSPASHSLLDALRQTEAFNLDFFPTSEDKLERLLDSGQVSLGLVIPPGLARNLAGGEPASIQVLVDGTKPNEALLSLSYVNQIVRRTFSEIEVRYLRKGEKQIAFGKLPSVLNQIRAWYLPELRYIHFVMVSMVALAVVMLGVLLAAAGVVREKENGTMEQLMVTPIRPLELTAAKVMPLILMEIIGLFIGIAISGFIFGVAPHGNPVATLSLFVALSTLAFLASAGIGILIGTYARNLMQALLLAFFVLFPMMFLSGTITPVTAMPVWLQWLSYISPMRHYLSLSLDIFLKGVGLNVVWPHVTALASFTFLILWIALRRFRGGLA